jgi:acetyl esterase/lipase
VLALGLLAASAARADEHGPARFASPFIVEQILDVRYHTDHKQQALDVFRPRGVASRPVLLFIHGGSWVMGDKDLLGLYRGFGRFLARQGIVAVMVNYRLSPAVKHPAHVRDVARAFAWVRRHIHEHGGDSDCIVLCGHSAGGHLAALLATDETYLKDEALKLTDADRAAVRGVIGIGGVYHIPVGDRFAGLAANMVSGALDQGRHSAVWRLGMTLALREAKGINPFRVVFGDDPTACDQASPVCHVRKGLPPFLLLNAQWDLPTLPEMAEEFAQALREKGNMVERQTIRWRDHNMLVFPATNPSDPVAREILGFVERQARSPRR